MAQKTFIINSTQATFSDEELQFIQSLIYTEGVFGDPDTGLAGMAVKSQETPDKSVRVAVGNSIIDVTIDGRSFKSAFQNLEEETVTIDDNSSGTARTDTVVAFLDTATELDGLKTNVGSFRVIKNSGTTASTDAQIDVELGSGNWLRLADIAVANDFSTITNAEITDRRNHISHTQAINASNALNPNLTQRETSDGGIDQEQTTDDDVGIDVGETDSATNNYKVAQSFIPTTSGIRGVIMHKTEDIGTFTGDVTIEIQSDNNNSPSGGVLAEYTFDNDEWLELPNYQNLVCVFDEQYEGFERGETYWIVVSTSTADDDNHIQLGADDGNSYADGGGYINNTTDGWTAISGTDFYFQTMQNTKEKIVKTNENGEVPAHMLSAQVVYTDLNIGTEHRGNITTDWETYLELDLNKIWELYILLRIKLYLSGTAGEGDDNKYQKIRMRIDDTIVFDFSISTLGVNTNGGVNYSANAEINIQSSTSINEFVSFVQTQTIFDKFEGDESYPTYHNHEGDSHTDTDLRSRTLVVEVKNNTNNSYMLHRFRGVIVDKSTVENQHRVHYSPV